VQKSQIHIKQIACGYNHCIALSASDEIFVWGRRMGIYPNVELTFHQLKANNFILMQDIHQNEPRLVKNNLIFYKIKTLVTGPFNSALITDDNSVLI
jgi:hypothetical protein